MTCDRCQLQADLFRAHEDARADSTARVEAMRRERGAARRAWARRFKAMRAAGSLVIRKPAPFQPLTLEGLGFTAGGVQ